MSLGQYDAWLDEMERHVRVEGGAIVCDPCGFRMPLGDCRDVDYIVLWARRLEEALSRDSERAWPTTHVLRKFVQLAKEHSTADFNIDEVVWEAMLFYRRERPPGPGAGEPDA